MLSGTFAFLSLWGAVGGIGLSSASQVDVEHHVEAGPYTAKVANNERLDQLSKENAKAGWTCPMHPEVHKHEAGKCPICKMNLVKAKNKKV
jgi:hypothetical protein